MHIAHSLSRLLKGYILRLHQLNPAVRVHWHDFPLLSSKIYVVLGRGAGGVGLPQHHLATYATPHHHRFSLYAFTSPPILALFRLLEVSFLLLISFGRHLSPARPLVSCSLIPSMQSARYEKQHILAVVALSSQSPLNPCKNFPTFC